MSDIVNRFVESGAAHINEHTGCLIWEGDLNKSRQPVIQGQLVRTLIWQQEHDEVLPRGIEIISLCENDRCVSPVHMEKNEKEMNTEVTFTPEEMQQFLDLNKEGFKREVIAAKMNTSAARISRMARVARTQGVL